MQPKMWMRPKKTITKIDQCWTILISGWHQKFCMRSNFQRHFSIETQFKNERFHYFFNCIYWQSERRQIIHPKIHFCVIFVTSIKQLAICIAHYGSIRNPYRFTNVSFIISIYWVPKVIFELDANMIIILYFLYVKDMYFNNKTIKLITNKEK